MNDEHNEFLEEAEELADKAMEPETFSFLSVIQGRSYPTDSVKVCMDEAAAYDLRKAQENHAGEEELERLRDRVKAATFTVKLVGIPQEKRDEATIIAENQFPTKYEQYRNPKNGQLERYPLANRDQDNHENDLILGYSIAQIEAPNGAVDTAPGLAVAQALRLQAPLAEFAKIHTAMIKLLAASVKLEEKVDATFPDGGSDVA